MHAALFPTRAVSPPWDVITCHMLLRLFPQRLIGLLQTLCIQYTYDQRGFLTPPQPFSCHFSLASSRGQMQLLFDESTNPGHSQEERGRLVRATRHGVAAKVTRFEFLSELESTTKSC